MLKRVFATLLLSLLFLGRGARADSLSPAAAKKLDNDIRYLVGQQSGFADISVAVVDWNGTVSQVNGKRAFPLASVFKLPILMAILDGQDKGTYPGMASSLTLSNSDLCIGSGSLADQGAGSSVTVDKAARLMMSVSDNTATDLLFRELGPEKLDPWLHDHGFKSSEIILTNRQAWLLALGRVPGWGKTTPQARVQSWGKLDRTGRLSLAQKIEAGARDLTLSQFQAIENASTGTQSAWEDNLLAAKLDNKMSALDLADLLIALDKGDLVSAQSRNRAFDILAGQKYHSRLPQGLSQSTDIYHKTGTLSGIRNDAGILFVGRRQEGVAVVFLTQSIKPGADGKMDRVAAQVAKLVEAAYL